MKKVAYQPFKSREWKLAHGRSLQLGPVSRMMGILNVTPDSFSDGGRFTSVDTAIDQAAIMIGEGADIIDVGGESTKPGAQPIDEAIEQERVMPVIEALCQRFETLVSIDTYRPKTAQLAIDAGAHMVNDIQAFQHDPAMAKVVAKNKAGVCLMHNSRKRAIADDLIDDQHEFLGRSLAIAKKHAVDDERIIIDPGFGFGKDIEENLEIMARFVELIDIGLPVLAGTSRKRFTGGVLEGEEDSEENRDLTTSATSVIARMAGAVLFRVHDVKTNQIALKMADAILQKRHSKGD